MRILVTGSRDVSDRDAAMVRRVLAIFGEKFEDGSYYIVGCCPSGVDSIVRRCYPDSLVCSADWDQHGRSAGPIRNQQMVDHGADLCLAFPGPNSKGTRDCMARARVALIPVLVMELLDE